MPRIDPWIVDHKIKTYLNVKLVRQKIRVVNPKKPPAIKAKIKKLLKVGFIYPVPLMKWVSNPVAVNKKEGKIRVCTNFQDLNKACPKDNYPTPFIDQILDDCSGDEIFSFMDGFSGYNQIQINTKPLSSALGAPSPIGKCCSALKMLEPLSSGLCLTHSMTSLGLWKLILMMSLLTPKREPTILLTLELLSIAVKSTK